MEDTSVRAARDVVVVFSRLRRRLREVADPHGLTPSQRSVLSRLDKDGPASASALATVERVRPQSMAATVGVLEQQAMIERRPDPDDGRRQLVELTEAGRAHVEGSRLAKEEWLVQALREHCTEKERRTVADAMALLDRLTHA